MDLLVSTFTPEEDSMHSETLSCPTTPPSQLGGEGPAAGSVPGMDPPLFPAYDFLDLDLALDLPSLGLPDKTLPSTNPSVLAQ